MSSPKAHRDRVVAFGDIVNDVVVVPKTGIRVDTDTTSTIRPRPGGSAANTAAWLGSLGTPTDFVGCVGIADLEHHAAELRRHSVIPHLSIAPGLPTSTIVIIVEGEHRTMLTERGANRGLTTREVSDELLEHAAVLHLTGYSLLDGPRAAGIRALIERAHSAGVAVSVNPGSAGFIADLGAEAFAEGIADADILFANVHEAQLLCADEPSAKTPERIAQLLGDRYGLAVITQGAQNVVVSELGNTPISVPVTAARLVDPTGAGDAMAAGFLNSWCVDRDVLRATQAGIRVAARAVMVMGGRPVI